MSLVSDSKAGLTAHISLFGEPGPLLAEVSPILKERG